MKKSTILAVISIYLTTYILMSEYIVTTSAGSLFADFPEVSQNMRNFILSGSSLFVVFSSLGANFLMRKWSKRTILAAATFIFGFATISSRIAGNLCYLAVTRAVAGLTMGAVASTAVSLLPELANDEKVKDYLVSGFHSAQSLLGIGISILAGLAAAYSWKTAFKMYDFSIVILVMLLLFVPKTSVNASRAGNKTAIFSLVPVLWMACSDVVFHIIYCMLNYQRALYIGETGLGGPRLAGAMGALCCGGIALGAMALPAVYEKLGKRTPTAFFLLLAVSQIGILIKSSMITCSFYFFVSGFSYGIAVGYYFVHVTYILPKERVPAGISILTAANGTGQFLSTYGLSAVQNLIGTDRISPVIPYLVGTILVAAGIGVITGGLKDRRKEMMKK